MSSDIYEISILHMLIGFIPVVPVLYIMYRWQLSTGNAVYSLMRMLIQLLIIGYLLTLIFKSDSSMIVLGILFIMVFASSWIALSPIQAHRTRLYAKVFISTLLGGGMTLVVVTQAVLQLDPWFLPSYMIPLAGMIFANAMNTISLAAERMNSELINGVIYDKARKVALQASLIPIINSMFAVGLVSLPGMMTGQILSGVSPLIAVRYQIVVMCMIFGSAGISAALFLVLAKRQYEAMHPASLGGDA